jgi:hypothetical protein
MDSLDPDHCFSQIQNFLTGLPASLGQKKPKEMVYLKKKNFKPIPQIFQHSPIAKVGHQPSHGPWWRVSCLTRGVSNSKVK